MRHELFLALALGTALTAGAVELPIHAQAEPQSAPVPLTAEPMPSPGDLLREVSSNQKKLEALRRDYTYHVHQETVELDKSGAVKKTETIDSESLTIDGVRVDRVVARNGQPLTPEQGQKESERIDKAVAQAQERRAKAGAKGTETDASGNILVPLSRILELGTFSNPRQVEQDDRPTILLDFAGNPEAKTHNPGETVMRDVAGTVWIDEADRVLVRAEGRFVNDFKLGGGLLADVHKGLTFDFRATRVGDSVWLPARIDGQGTARVFLFVNVHGRFQMTSSNYKRFHTSAIILAGPGKVDENGNPVVDAPPVGPPSASATPWQTPPQR